MPSRNELATALVAAQLRALREFAAAGLAPFVPRWKALDAYDGERSK